MPDNGGRPTLIALRNLWLTAIASSVLWACVGASPTQTSGLPEVEGEWAYSAFDIRVVGQPSAARCEITGVTLELGPWRSEGFTGRTEGGRLECSGELSPLSTDLPSYPVRRGGSVLDFIAFDIGSPDWRHDGKIGADTMGGIFWIQQPAYRLEGRFKATVIELANPSE